MVRNHSFGTLLVHAAVLVAAIGLLDSCSNAAPAAKKNAVAASKDRATDSTQNTVTAPSKESRRLVVYYFHGNARCPTCFKLENYAKSEVETAFADAIKAGRLEWKTVNVETKGNEHFGDDYKLYTKSVIVSIRQDGKEATWKNLDKIWQLVQDEAKYREYIRKEVGACLEGKCL